jgi:hypothetical protein
MSANELTVETLLRAHAPRAPESLRERVLALEPKRSHLALPSRRLVLVALPAAVAIAVAAALVHGIVGSGTNGVTAGGAADQPQVQVGSAATESSTPELKAAAPTTRSSRLQHTDASIQIHVADTDALAAATTRATRIATSLGGYAQSVDYSASPGGGGTSTIDLRVPAQNVKPALARLATLGTLVSQQLSVTDLEQRLQTQSNQIAQLRRRIAALREALQSPSLPEAQKVLLRIRLAESKRALAQRLSARKGTISAGATARISLVIGTEQAVVVPAHRGRFDRLLRSAAGFLALEGIVALYVLIVAGPLALLAGLVWLWRRRSIDRLLTA